MFLGWIDFLYSRMTMLIQGLHLCAITYLTLLLIFKTFLFLGTSSIYFTRNICKKTFLLLFLDNEWRELLHPDSKLDNNGIAEKNRLEETFGGYLVTAGLTQKLGQAF